ncbi:hypothetical protein NC652_038495 [Populus alba x Populus x berolinensis]|nr:hypothetical protein NC652_038495 [Populus alba x Populus x berolinensis]
MTTLKQIIDMQAVVLKKLEHQGKQGSRLGIAKTLREADYRHTSYCLKEFCDDTMQAKVRESRTTTPRNPLLVQEFTNPSLLYVFVWHFAGPAVKEYEQLQEATITCMLKMEKIVIVLSQLIRGEVESIPQAPEEVKHSQHASLSTFNLTSNPFLRSSSQPGKFQIGGKSVVETGTKTLRLHSPGPVSPSWI